MSNQLYIQKNWLFTEKLDAYLLNSSNVKQIVPRSQISSYGSSVLQSVQSSYLGSIARPGGIQLVIRGNPSTGSVQVLPVIHNLKRRNVAGNLPNGGF